MLAVVAGAASPRRSAWIWPVQMWTPKLRVKLCCSFVVVFWGGGHNAVGVFACVYSVAVVFGGCALRVAETASWSSYWVLPCV